MLDACLQMVEDARPAETAPWTQSWISRALRPWLLDVPTPHRLIAEAVEAELGDQLSQLKSQLDGLGSSAPAAAGQTQQNLIERLTSELDLAARPPRVPAELMRAMLAQERDILVAWPALAEVLSRAVARYDRFQQRLCWLLNPELTREQLHRLDPMVDADQIWNFVKYEFRPEFIHSAWGPAVKRVAQIPSLGTFIHSTGRSETKALVRNDETLLHYYFFHNWGQESYWGRRSIQNIDRVHSSYQLPADGLKYVLLNGGLTVLDSLSSVGHRALSETERLGYFHATINMGEAMGLSGLSHDWCEMTQWFHDVNRLHAAYSPLKRQLWDGIEESIRLSLGASRPFNAFRKRLQVIGIDETLRRALGYAAPSAAERAALRNSYRAVWSLRKRLPRRPYIESLQPSKSYPDSTLDVAKLGPARRSTRLPSGCPFAGIPPRSDRPAIATSPVSIHHEANDAGPTKTTVPTLPLKDVICHDHLDDLWVIVNGRVYDVTSFVRRHPGGQEVLQKSVGQDMGVLFDTRHSQMTKQLARNFLVGELSSEDAQRARSAARPKPQEVTWPTPQSELTNSAAE